MHKFTYTSMTSMNNKGILLNSFLAHHRKQMPLNLDLTQLINRNAKPLH